MTPLIDVIIPAYNAEKFITDAVESVMQPTVGQVIVVDDASKDDTYKTLKNLQEKYPKLTVLKQVTNGGQYVASNTGIQHIRPDAQYIAFQDADDLSTPIRFEKTLAAFQANPDLDIVSGWMTQINEYGKAHSEKSVTSNQIVINKELPENPIPVLDNHFAHVITNGVMTVRRGVFNVLGGFDASYGGGDTQFIIRAYYAGLQMKNIPELLGYRRHHAGQATHNNTLSKERSAYRTIVSTQWLWWKLLKEKNRLKPHHLRIPAITLPTTTG